jgi:hypothetical protein
LGRAALALMAALLAMLASWSTSAPAESTVFEGYAEVLSFHHGVPLAPTSLPPVFGPIASAPMQQGAERPGYYLMSFFHTLPGKTRPDAEIVLRNDPATKLTAVRRRSKRAWRVHGAVVLGHPALALRGRRTGSLALFWEQDGRSYELATPTPHTVTAAQLLQTANSAGHLLGYLKGSYLSGEGAFAEARVVVMDRDVLPFVEWGGQCLAPGADPFEAHGALGQASLGPLATSGGAFSAPARAVTNPHPHVEDPLVWTVSVSGTATPSSGQLTLQAGGEAGGRPCTFPPATMQLSSSEE